MPAHRGGPLGARRPANTGRDVYDAALAERPSGRAAEQKVEPRSGSQPMAAGRKSNRIPYGGPPTPAASGLSGAYGQRDPEGGGRCRAAQPPVRAAFRQRHFGSRTTGAAAVGSCPPSGHRALRQPLLRTWTAGRPSVRSARKGRAGRRGRGGTRPVRTGTRRKCLDA
ncbi:hypothetical protein GCM10010392_63070 [Streptomyces clavifer]|nr:hypothetical protein GCM10010392_63070 [Streptomyces clavifer]